MARYGRIGDRFTDSAGDPLVKGKLYFFESGTNTDKDTFADENSEFKNTNPVILNADGSQPNIFFNGTAKVILTDQDDVQLDESDPEGDTGGGGFQSYSNFRIYNIPDIVVGSNDRFYRCIKDGTQGVDPVTETPNDSANWTEERYISQWNVKETYYLNKIVEGMDGFLYTSKIDNNLGNDPTTDTVNWGPSVEATIPAVVNAAAKIYAFKNL